MYHGSCLCGGITFAVRGALAPIQVCHCSQCRKAQGGPFATNLPLARADFQLLSGGELLRAYSASPGKRRWFCARCGSPIYSERDALPGILRLRVGTLDGDLPTRAAVHLQVASAANWWPLDDALPRYPGSKPD
ncbi:GFA family protein [Pseudomonas panipatensis]|uniref:Uncharacterized conserved protein n=1 Tax=Pseudomonas panipatensis TaxID=428992 RepID=A0A1G8IK80_9PSED|nr:GFA family protein [Pseudomonas panipatensis]SDI19314.1 Uncharacterized conserved protein [Pseudomonas panipatensis]SMP73699.1 Uncharacterized conserved protein [Pseudomonas panipatensis]